ncbi:hypothetical protein ScPMuIL_007862 [Solemya velum]
MRTWGRYQLKSRQLVIPELHGLYASNSGEQRMNMSQYYSQHPNMPQFHPGMTPNDGMGHIRIKAEPMDNYSYHHLASEMPFASEPIPHVGEKRKMKSELDEQYNSQSCAMTPTKSKAPKKKLKQEKITEHLKTKKKRDRFNGMPEDEVLQRKLPDHLQSDLDIVIVGINPGLQAAYVGHHYAGPGNHFWKCMYLSGLLPEPMNAYDDHKLLDLGIGFTNIVSRTTRGSADIPKKEVQEGAKTLVEKLRQYKPKIAAFNGKGIYEIFIGHKNFHFGKQPKLLEGTNTTVYVMPSSSARCSQLPRAVDKVPFYVGLKILKNYLTGMFDKLDESEVCFPDVELKVVKSEKKESLESKDHSILQQCKSGQQDAPDQEKKPKKRGRKKKSDLKKEEEAVSNFNTHGCDSSAADIKPPALLHNFYRPYACETIKQENVSSSHCRGQQPLTHGRGPAVQDEGLGQPYGQNMLVPYSQVQASCNNEQVTNSYNQFQNDNNMALSQPLPTSKDNCYSQYQNAVSTATALPAQYQGAQQMTNSLYQPYLPNPSQFQQMSRFSFQNTPDQSLSTQGLQGSGFVNNQIAVKTENTNFQASMKSCSMYSSTQGVSHSQLSSSMTASSSMAFSISQNPNGANSEYSTASYSSSQSHANSTDISGSVNSSFNNQSSVSPTDSSNQIQCTSTSAFTPYSQTGMSNFITQSNAIISVKCEPTDFGYGGICHYDACDG